MLQQISDNFYRLEIPLPGNPLRTLNSYIMLSDDRHLIIDTGFNMPECLDALRAGIHELQLDMSKTDVLVTHLHSDHLGLVPQIISKTSKVYMGRIDKAIFKEMMENSDTYWGDAEKRFQEEGYPTRELAQIRSVHPGIKFAPEDVFDTIDLDDGDTVSCGDFHWKVILTPGHTPGHICLYEPTRQIFIAGDLLLFDITPNISCWNELDDALESYLTSLKNVSALEVKTILTGHRSNEGSFSQRIKELEAHHAKRLKDVLDIVRENPSITGYDVASKMTWSIRAKDWADFPPGQRWFAVGEAISHIDYLVLRGQLQRVNRNGVNTYTLS